MSQKEKKSMKLQLPLLGRNQQNTLTPNNGHNSSKNGLMSQKNSGKNFKTGLLRNPNWKYENMIRERRDMSQRVTYVEQENEFELLDQGQS